MCGFAGILDTARRMDLEELGDTALRMADRLAHRGPDDRGVWADADTGIALGFRRLAIVDLSPEGHQPMTSACGRYVIAFNGEVYNHRSLRKDLEGGADGLSVRFRGHSDTEVLLAAIARWGLRRAVERSAGMFAFALWDRRERRLHLVRDRIGEKPLYYGWMGRTLLFGSELKALRAHPDLRRRGRPGCPGRLHPARLRTRPALHRRGRLQAHPGDDPDDRPGSARRHPRPRSPTGTPGRSPRPARATRSVGATRRRSTGSTSCSARRSASQMVADVPLGAFLSGGVDSSTIVALMQAQSGRPVETFTIGFREEGYDEAAHAKAVARHLGTRHTELVRDAERGDGGHPRPAQALRRAVRRLVADPDDPRLEAGARVGDREPLGRRGRRALRRLRPLPEARSPLGGDPENPPVLPQGGGRRHGGNPGLRMGRPLPGDPPRTGSQAGPADHRGADRPDRRPDRPREQPGRPLHEDDPFGRPRMRRPGGRPRPARGSTTGRPGEPSPSGSPRR